MENTIMASIIVERDRPAMGGMQSVEARRSGRIIAEAERLEHLALAAEEIERKLDAEVNRIVGAQPTKGRDGNLKSNEPHSDLDRLSMAVARTGAALEQLSETLDRVRGI
jgi:predicted RNA-binding protein with EMAP domain